MNNARFYAITFLLLFTFLNSSAQDLTGDQMKWVKGWTDFKPNDILYPEADEMLSNAITSDTFLRNDVVYSISGDVYVMPGATLTIEEGTIVRCDADNPATLFITKGAKLIAQGSKSRPIVFTSSKSAKDRKSGDWGGIIIAGSGKVNASARNGIVDGDFNPQHTSYGGDNYDEETTILQYIRIEFPGNKLKKSTGVSGLALYGVGNRSIVNNIMVSHSAYDSFEFKGGKLTTKNLISYKAQDDDYEISKGFKGEMSSIIAIRHPYITSARGSYAIEIDGYDNKTGYVDSEELTDVTITDASLLNLADKTNYQYTMPAISARNAASIYIHNARISGFSDVVKFDRSYTSLAMIQKLFNLDNSFFNIHREGVIVEYKPNNGSQDILKYNRFTKTFKGITELFQDPMNESNPRFTLKQSLNQYMVVQ